MFIVVDRDINVAIIVKSVWGARYFKGIKDFEKSQFA